MDLATMPGALRPASGPPARPRKLRRGPLTRKQILDASLKLFSDKGFVRTSVRDIAQAAGITDAAIYYHFASKRDLFEALIEERGFTAVLEQLERAEITDGPDVVIPRIACSALEFLYQNRDLLKVLLVEDDPGDVLMTREAFEENKVANRLAVVPDGVDAMAFLRKEGEYADAPTPDLVLLDLNLPRMDGREVLAAMKSDPELRRIPVVVLTTSEAEEDVLRSYSLHANAYVTKPVDFQRFIDVVRQIDDFFVSVVRLPNH